MATTPVEDREPVLLTQDQALALSAAFPELEQTELLHGVLWHTVRENPPHAGLKQRLNMWLARGVDPEHVAIRVESSFSVSDPHSLPNPDLLVVPADQQSFAHLPRASPLVIEIADTSFRRDLRVKAPLYADTEVAEYWVVDVNRRRVLVHTAPGPEGYGEVHTVERTAVLQPQFVAIEPLDLAALFAGLD